MPSNSPGFTILRQTPFSLGFVGGDAHQWQPNLFRNTTQIYPFDGKPGWNLITGMADDAIDYISPMLLNSSYTIAADITIPEGGAEGMILTSGGRFCGYGFYLLQGKPVFLWNLIDLKRIKWEGPEALAPGNHTVEFDFQYEGLGVGTLAFNNMSGLGRPGTGTLKVDGKVVATQKMEKTIPMILQWDESFDIGSDTLTGVNDDDYKPPFTFTGKLNKLTLKIDRPRLSPEDIKKLKAAMRNNKMSE